MRMEPIVGTVKAMTHRAVLMELDEQHGEQEVWIPLSVINENDLPDLIIGDHIEINVAGWFYDQNIEID